MNRPVDHAAEPGVLGAPNLTHPTGAELRHDAISSYGFICLEQLFLPFFSECVSI